MIRSGAPRVLTLAAAFVLTIAACSTSLETSADEAPGEPAPTATEIPSPDDTSESAPPDGTDQPGVREVPPLVLPDTAPGSDEAAQALLDDLDRFVTDEQRAAGVPWPDLRNPDPIAAYQASARFQNWMSENNVTPSLVEAYTAPGSPERGWDLDMFDFLNSNGLLSTPSEPPYSMRVEDLVHPAATGITDALLATVPEGSAAVVYWDSVGVSNNITADGQIFNTSPGWSDLGPWVAIMAPTDVGWQVWWDELTEPPPPGSRPDQGLPDEDQERRDV